MAVGSAAAESVPAALGELMSGESSALESVEGMELEASATVGAHEVPDPSAYALEAESEPSLAQSVRLTPGGAQ